MNSSSSSNKNDDLNIILDLLQKQEREIEQLKNNNKKILEKLENINKNSEKMGKHIDFINRSYDKIANSYLFKNMFNS
jgi:DNA anti-recombination protein RmuC